MKIVKKIKKNENCKEKFEENRKFEKNEN